jgi:hypothetical protein
MDLVRVSRLRQGRDQVASMTQPVPQGRNECECNGVTGEGVRRHPPDVAAVRTSGYL